MTRASGARPARRRLGAAALASLVVVAAGSSLPVWGTAAPAGPLTPIAAAQTVRYVDDDAGCDGQSPCYTSIQAAVDAALDGDILRLAPGAYAETVVVVDKGLAFDGPGIGDPEEPDDESVHTLWAPAGTGSALTIDARSRDITGTVVGGIRFGAGVPAVRLVGRRVSAPELPSSGLPASSVDTDVVGARVEGNLFRGGGPLSIGLQTTWCNALRIQGNVAVDARIVFYGGDVGRLDRNRFVGSGSDPGLAVAVIEAVAHGRNLRIEDNAIYRPSGAGIRLAPLAAPGFVGEARGVVVARNAITSPTQAGISVYAVLGGQLTDLRLVGNSVLGSAGAGGTRGAVEMLGADGSIVEPTLEAARVVSSALGAGHTIAGIYAESVEGTLWVTGTHLSGGNGPGVHLVDVGGARIVSSTVTGHREAVRLTERSGAFPRAAFVIGGAPELGNRLAGNGDAALVLENETGTSVSTADVLATYNDWGTADRGRIEDRVVHRVDDIVLGLVTYWPALAAADSAALESQPPSLIADGTSQAEVTLRARDPAGEAVADDSVVVFATQSGRLAHPGAVVEAESGAVSRSGEWGVYDSDQFGPNSGGRYVRSDAVGSSIAWSFDGSAALVRLGQTVLNTGTLSLALDGASLPDLATAGPQTVWVDRVLATELGSGSHRVTLTVASGEVNVDFLASGTTTKRGDATTTLTSAASVGFGRVSARVFGANGGRTATLDVPFTAGQPAVLSVSVGESQVQVGGSTTPVTVTATDAMGRPVPDGTPVQWTAGLGTVEPAAGVTLGGRMAATYRSGDDLGQDTVRAESGAAFATAPVRVVPGPPAQLVLSASKTSMPANSTSTVEVRAEVRDASGNPVLDGTTVALSMTLGSLEPRTPGTAGGVARSRLRSGAVAGEAIVSGRCGDATASLTVTLAGTDISIGKTVEPASVVVPGESVTFTLSYANEGAGTVYDVIIDDQLPVGLISPTVRTPAGELFERLPDRPLAFRKPRLLPGERGDILVTLKVDTSLLWGPRTVVTNRASIHSPLAAESNPDDNEGAGDVVVVPGAVYTVTVSAGSPVVVGGATATVRARLTDRYGNPSRDGTVVVFSTNLGSVRPEVATTANGRADTTFTSGTLAGAATVRAVTVDDRGGSAKVQVSPGPASRLGLVTGRSWITVGGDSTVVTATLADQYDNAVRGAVDFETDNGLLSVRQASTDSAGVATSTLRSGVRVATATVRARSGTLTRSVPVAFRAGEATVIDLELDRWHLQLGDRATALATVLDRFGNPVPSQTVEFRSTIAQVRQPIVDTDATGRAATTLIATSVGSGVVRALTGPVSAVRVLEVSAAGATAYLPFGTR